MERRRLAARLKHFFPTMEAAGPVSAIGVDHFYPTVTATVSAASGE
jgi:hypothetical protein